MQQARVQDRLLEDAQVRRNDDPKLALSKRDGARAQRGPAEEGNLHGESDEGGHGGHSLGRQRDATLRIAHEVRFYSLSV